MTPTTTHTLQEGDVIYEELGTPSLPILRRYIIDRVSAKRAFIGPLAFRREAFAGKSLTQVGADPYFRTQYYCATPALDVQYAEQFVRNKAQRELESVGNILGNLTPDRVAALRDALKPFLPA